MNPRIFSSKSFCFTLFFICVSLHAAPPQPNIVVILADDLGYGDVRCFNPQGKISTPHLDRLAAQGMIFTDAHSSSAVCTPTRYGLLTGRYNWRSRLKSGVQGGLSPPLIEPGRLTLPTFLKRQGYHTACIGKWHLGMDWPRKPDAAPFGDGIEKGEDGWRVDFSQPIQRGPTAFGFDYYFGIAASLDMVPYTFIENNRVTKLPTSDKAFPMMLGRTNRMTRRGPAADDFEAEGVLPELTREAVAWIERRAPAAKSNDPFFLYLPLTSPHTPIVPTPEWQGKSGLNSYADFVMQTDAAVGTVLETLHRLNLADNTLVIFTSDNGCSPEADFNQLRASGHHPSGRFRGAKADIFEGGHRVPFIARWPGRVKPGSSTSQLISLNDIFATCAEILDRKMPADAAEDSISLLPALEGRASKPSREALVHHSINGSFAIRRGDWKLILAPDSGGWSSPRPGSPAAKDLPAVQLYNLRDDISETNNLQGQHPRIVADLTSELQRYVKDGRSTPGPRQANTTPVKLPDAASTDQASHQPNSERNRFATTGQNRPNFLFLFSDDQTHRALGALRELEVKTPNLNRLARRGMLFTHCFNQGGWSGAVCIPSRAMLNTGRTLWRSRGGTNQTLAPDVPLWGETFGRAGYDTFMAGKWHLPDAALKRSFQTIGPLTGGFLPSTTNGGPAYFRPAPGNPWTPDDPKWAGQWMKVDGKTIHSSSLVANAAIDFLRTNASRSTKPFFMYVAFTAPHDPRQAPREFLDLYKPARLDIPPNFLPRHPFLIEGNFHGRDEILAAYPRTPEIIQTHFQEYYAIISHLDSEIGRILDALETSGREDNTIVIFTSDQGLAVGQHGLLGKQNLYDHSLRMPFIMAGPGIPAGKRNDALFNMQSLYATTCQMAGIPLPPSVEFPNIVPLITGQKKKIHDALYAAFLDRQRAVRTAEWKLIRSPKVGVVQLFNIRRDPWERRNLAGDPKYADTLRDLDEQLRELMRALDDPMPFEELFAASEFTSKPLQSK